MNIQNIDIIGQLERLAESCPWDSVDIWITRYPEGAYWFTAYIHPNDKFQFPAIFGHAESPEEAVNMAIKRMANRDPEICRKKVISELQDKIPRLQSIVIGMPPYRPNTNL